MSIAACHCIILISKARTNFNGPSSKIDKYLPTYFIGSFAFSESYLTSVTISSSVTTVGYGSFFHCTALTVVAILEGVISIEVLG